MSESRVPAFNSCTMLPLWNCVGVSTGVIRGSPGVPQGPRQSHTPESAGGGVGCFTRNSSLLLPFQTEPLDGVPWLPLPQILSSATCTSGSPWEAGRLASKRRQTHLRLLLLLLLPGWGSGNLSSIHLFIQHMLTGLLRVSPCPGHWGFSEFTRSPHHSVPNSSHLHLGLQKASFSFLFFFFHLCVCMFTRGGGQGAPVHKGQLATPRQATAVRGV